MSQEESCRSPSPAPSDRSLDTIEADAEVARVNEGHELQEPLTPRFLSPEVSGYSELSALHTESNETSTGSSSTSYGPSRRASSGYLASSSGSPSAASVEAGPSTSSGVLLAAVSWPSSGALNQPPNASSRPEAVDDDGPGYFKPIASNISTVMEQQNGAAIPYAVVKLEGCIGEQGGADDIMGDDGDNYLQSEVAARGAEVDDRNIGNTTVSQLVPEGGVLAGVGRDVPGKSAVVRRMARMTLHLDEFGHPRSAEDLSSESSDGMHIEEYDKSEAPALHSELQDQRDLDEVERYAPPHPSQVGSNVQPDSNRNEGSSSVQHKCDGRNDNLAEVGIASSAGDLLCTENQTESPAHVPKNTEDVPPQVTRRSSTSGPFPPPVIILTTTLPQELGQVQSFDAGVSQVEDLPKHPVTSETCDNVSSTAVVEKQDSQSEDNPDNSVINERCTPCILPAAKLWKPKDVQQDLTLGQGEVDPTGEIRIVGETLVVPSKDSSTDDETMETGEPMSSSRGRQRGLKRQRKTTKVKIKERSDDPPSDTSATSDSLAPESSRRRLPSNSSCDEIL